MGNEDGLLESLALSQLWEGPQGPVSLTVAGRLGYLGARCVGSVKCGDDMDWERGTGEPQMDTLGLVSRSRRNSPVMPRFSFTCCSEFQPLLMAWGLLASPSPAIDCSWLSPGSDSLGSRAVGPTGTPRYLTSGGRESGGPSPALAYWRYSVTIYWGAGLTSPGVKGALA